jgi:hypothetical protein
MDSKENEFGSFSKMLRKLEMENVALPELRQLKQEHTYLEKLRQQRSKVLIMPRRSKSSNPSTMQ